MKQIGPDGILREVQFVISENELLQNTLQSYELFLDNYINQKAAEKGYDSRITVAMRAGYQGPWQEECIRFAQWMDSCYLYAYQVKDDVLAGRRSAPTREELIAELPTFSW